MILEYLGSEALNLGHFEVKTSHGSGACSSSRELTTPVRIHPAPVSLSKFYAQSAY